MPQPNIKDSILVRMLACLSKKEQKGFRAYLACPLFNTNSTLEALGGYLLDHATKSSDPPLPETALVKALGISDGLVDKLFSQLLRLLNDFACTWTQLQEKQRDPATVFRFWMAHDLEPNLLEREYRKLKRQFGRQAFSDLHIWEELQLEHQYSVYQTMQPRREQADLFAVHLHLLDQYYLVVRLKYLCAATNGARIFRQPLPPGMAISDEQLKLLPPLGMAWWHAHELLQAETPSLAQAQSLFELLVAIGAQFSEEDHRSLLGFLLNGCFRELARGNQDFLGLAISAYEHAFAHGVLMQNGKLSQAHFKNFISLKSRSGDLQATRAFIHSHHQQLPESDRQSFLNYGEGMVFFGEKNYSQAIAKFREVVQTAPEDLFLSLDARNMLWKAYFEGGEGLGFEEHEEMLRLYHSFRVFVARNQRISDHHKSCYENFIRLFNQLIRTDEKGKWIAQRSDYEQVLEEVRQTEKLMHKTWLEQAILKKMNGDRG